MVQITEDTPIQQFYKDKNVFLTGATGFLGKVVLEKLLRATEVRQIYVLMREKRGKSVKQRLDQLFDDPIFEKMKTLRPNYREKLTINTGDCTISDLGISIEDRKALVENVNIVIHGAATVRFDEKIKFAVRVNVGGTQQLLQLAEEMKYLRVFVYVSTAFSNCNRDLIGENIYESSMCSATALQFFNSLDEDVLDIFTCKIVEGHPNTYTYTKNLAENVLKSFTGKFPLVVVRPGVILPTTDEPVPGWIDNTYGPAGVIVAVGMGLLRVPHVSRNIKSHLVPVDYCANAILAGAWDASINSYTTPPIYNFVQESGHIITWLYFYHKIVKYFETSSYKKCVWYPRPGAVEYFPLCKFLAFFFHLIPALVFDLGMKLTGNKTILFKAYRKITLMTDSLDFFVNHNIEIDSTNVQKLVAKCHLSDRKLFNFNMATIDWKDTLSKTFKGVHLYIMKEDPLKVDKGKTRRLKIVHYTTKTIMYLIGLWMLYTIFKLYFL